ncbi:hypothetical protein RQ831_12100 [Roseomonas gilardii]|uniref:Uncharacterized protein n=1 Tax=Roseomonas gilardii TaxID=257708 RepID=A0ABU3MG53_9PROT|nr:hypothetical protein [Roseomonas gilardii]MDT8331797.1 hypothetical protein [Roseomonas gilardii]
MRTIEDIETDLAEAEAAYGRFRQGEAYERLSRQKQAERYAWTKVSNLRIERERLLTGWQPVPEEDLERAFPYAKHRAIVEFQGRHFRAHYYPAKETPRGQPVKKWLREWSEVRDAPAALAALATVEPTATSARESTTDAP